MGVEVGGEVVGRLDGVGGRRSGVGGWESGWGGVGWEFGWKVGWGMGGPYVPQSNNKHTRNNQCKMIMGNIIVCPAEPKNFKY